MGSALCSSEYNQLVGGPCFTKAALEHVMQWQRPGPVTVGLIAMRHEQTVYMAPTCCMCCGGGSCSQLQVDGPTKGSECSCFLGMDGKCTPAEDAAADAAAFAALREPPVYAHCQEVSSARADTVCRLSASMIRQWVCLRSKVMSRRQRTAVYFIYKSATDDV